MEEQAGAAIPSCHLTVILARTIEGIDSPPEVEFDYAIEQHIHTLPVPITPATVNRGHRMKASVDEKLCIGCEHCVHECPDVFSMEGDIARVFVNMVPTDLEQECKNAVAVCPVDAIQITP